MEECVRMMSQSLRSSGTMKKKAKSVYNQRNLGTIKERKKEKLSEKEINNGEVIMRILRMRYVVYLPCCYFRASCLLAFMRSNKRSTFYVHPPSFSPQLNSSRTSH